MRDYVESVLDLIGLPNNTIHVVEELSLVKTTFLYPNFFITKEVNTDLKDSEVIDEIEGIIQEHLEEVQKELEMVRRYKREFYGKEDINNGVPS